MKKKHEEQENCKCGCEHEQCGCEHEDCGCGHESCNCGDDCNCTSEQNCGCDCNHEDRTSEYLELARKVQAEFDNYRKRSAAAFDNARENGMIDAVKVFLPCLDAFKKAKTMIKDKSSLEGVEMVEREIFSSLEKLGVEPINALGEKLNPKLHNVVAIITKPDTDDDIIVEEYMQGFKTKDKVIRYSQVIVNKKGE